MTTIWIAESVVEEMLRESEHSYPDETGGLLVGYWSAQADQAVVTDAVGPGPRSVHGRGHFAPDYDFHDSEVARLYTASDGALTYLGDWHSHGSAAPYLSIKDRHTLHGIGTDPGSGAPRALMAVWGDGPDWRFRVWEYRRTRFPRLTYAWSAVECEVRSYHGTGSGEA
jgi:integrative and conjugative element protein (TIGR02256 family)